MTYFSNGSDHDHDNYNGTMSGSLPAEISIAPMIGWTDRNFRFLFRHISRESLLYSEMLMDSALVFNTDINRLEDYLGFDKIIEPPVALQLGGNNPETLGRAVETVERYGGYHEINLNCGCPSNKAKKVGFGAELMLEHDLVRQLVSTMKRRASSCDITVKCRIGTNRNESWEQLLSFVRACRDGGIRKMVIHARICMLSGLSPAQNRTIPPLRYDVVHQLVAAFPDMRFILNGGLQSYEDIDNHINSTGCGVEGLRDVFKTGSLNYLSRLADDNNYTPIYSSSRQAMPYEDIIQDSTASCRFNDIPSSFEQPVTAWSPAVHGVMIGREAYNNPWRWADIDRYYYRRPNPGYSRREVLDLYLDYAELCQQEGRYRSTAAYLCKPLHNFFHGCLTNRLYKQKLDHLLKACPRSLSDRFVSDKCDESLRELVSAAVEGTIPDSFMDEVMGPAGAMVAMR